MVKKSFATAKVKPTQADLEAFVRSGPGHDRPAAPATSSGEKSRFTLELPVDLHRRWKAACAARGRKMGPEVQVLIEARLVELESQG